MQEQRALRRHHLDKRSTVMSHRLYANCQVRNISPTGACIELDSRAVLPASVRLPMPNCGTASAKLVWQRGKLAGVAFDQPLNGDVLTQYIDARAPVRQERQVARDLASTIGKPAARAHLRLIDCSAD
ncbi:hypothetical protein [Afifella sp. H1R]|uniref:hypothetical protein n=1 Tax=unclassified Afifella TaxID=2624128 RepID=UPI001F34FFF1|nr:hypothetical protein [Afifella sp. H1R]MCF1505625.1 hypothetical protein [Afifella sp. H1R]